MKRFLKRLQPLMNVGGEWHLHGFQRWTAELCQCGGLSVDGESNYALWMTLVALVITFGSFLFGYVEGRRSRDALVNAAVLRAQQSEAAKWCLCRCDATAGRGFDSCSARCTRG